MASRVSLLQMRRQRTMVQAITPSVDDCACSRSSSISGVMARSTLPVVIVSTRWRSRKKATVPMGSNSAMHSLPFCELGESWVVGVPGASGAVIGFGPLLVQGASHANAFHQVWICDVVATEGEEIAQALLEQLLSVACIDPDIEH